MDRYPHGEYPYRVLAPEKKGISHLEIGDVFIRKRKLYPILSLDGGDCSKCPFFDVQCDVKENKIPLCYLGSLESCLIFGNFE